LSLLIYNENCCFEQMNCEMKRRRIVMSVINDLATDQRVSKVCNTLYNNGFDILLIGRKLKNSLPIDDRPYKYIRMRLLFTKGFMFYLCFNMRLFFKLLFTKATILHANDLDTLLPNYLISKIKKVPLVYDTHELFTEVPELTSRPKVQKIWQRIERRIFPKLKHVFTVNDSIAGIYKELYGVEINVLRNLPLLENTVVPAKISDYGIDTSQKIIILQGAGINIHRGAEELVASMQYIDGAVLIIAGNGDVIKQLKEYVTENKLQTKIHFLEKMPYKKLMTITASSHCGVSLDKDTNLNYRYSLPNKIFDYIRADIPVLVSDLPEVRSIVKQYDVGLIIESHNPKHIAEGLKKILFDFPENHWQEQLQKARQELCWEEEQKKLIEIYERI
jgi:glycosyltransferase involved in cell wall biosynthesis